MNCIATQRVLELYVDGELEFAARKSVEEHLGHCIACGEELTALRRLAARTHDALPDVAAPLEMDRAILNAIAAAPPTEGMRARGSARRAGTPIATLDKAMGARGSSPGSWSAALCRFFEDVARAFGIVGEWFRDNGRWRF